MKAVMSVVFRRAGARKRAARESDAWGVSFSVVDGVFVAAVFVWRGAAQINCATTANEKATQNEKIPLFKLFIAYVFKPPNEA